MRFGVAASQDPKRDSWDRLKHALDETGRGESESFISARNRLLEFTVRTLSKTLPNCATTQKAIAMEVDRVIDVHGRDAIRQNHEPYRQGDFFEKTVSNLCKELHTRYGDDELQSRDWNVVLDDLCGESSIPMTTIHKSKGLEYHTVVFCWLGGRGIRRLL